MARTDRAHVRMFQRDSVTHFPPTVYESLTHALQSCEEWWEGTTLYGNTMLVRLSTVSDVHLMTDEGIAAYRDDAEAQPWEAC